MSTTKKENEVKKMNIYEKLLKVQTELNAPKDKKNNFGNYSYRSAEGILKNLRPFMMELKFIVLFQDDVEFVNNRYYVKATAKMLDVESGESVEAYAYARDTETKKGNDEAQISGATSSYARKYALGALFAIDDGNDNDSTGYKKMVKDSNELEKQRTDFNTYLASIGRNTEWVEKTFGIQSINNLNLSQFKIMVKNVKSWVEDVKKKAEEKK